MKTDGSWIIPIIIENRSAAFAEDINVSVTVENPSSCESIIATDPFNDASNVNPGNKIFMLNLERGIHRGMPIVVGRLIINMKTSKRIKRRLDISMVTYANRMRPRKVKYTLSLAKSKFTVKTVSDKHLY